MKTIDTTDPEIFAAALAAQFAKELGLPSGNYWEPGIACAIVRDLETWSPASVEEHFRIKLGLPPVPPPRVHPLADLGYDVTPAPGRYIAPDGWTWGDRLVAGEEPYPLRLMLPSGRNGGPIKSLAVRIEVTGRTVQKWKSGDAVRVRIVFLGDGEPDTSTGGYMDLRRKWHYDSSIKMTVSSHI